MNNRILSTGTGSGIHLLPGFLLAALMLSGCNLLTEPVLLNAAGGNLYTPATLKAISVQTRHNPKLLSIPGVIGTGIGQDAAGSPIVVVFAKHAGITDEPEHLEEFAVEVETLGELVPLQAGNGKGAGNSPADSKAKADATPNITCSVDRLARAPRQVPLGVSAGVVGFSGGTYGVRLKDAAGKLYMLSNNHTFAGRNRAPIGAPAVQPRQQDGGRAPDDMVGRLADFEPLVFHTVIPGAPSTQPVPLNVMDAAVVSTTAELAGNSTPCDGYGTPRSTVMEAKPGTQVMKYGRTTGLTQGVVTAVNVTIDIAFGLQPNGNLTVARFSGQTIVRQPGFCDSGDSGSLVVGKDGNPIGLLFAGSPDGSGYCVVNPIAPILSRFGMTVDGI